MLQDEITPEHLFWNLRRWIQAAALAGSLPISFGAYRLFNPIDIDVVLQPELKNFVESNHDSKHLLENGFAVGDYRPPLGLLAFLYAIAHVAIYVVYDRTWNYQEAWSEVVARRYLQFGALAVMLMLPLAITSTPFWVWCLGFRRWKSLHRLIYPASIAAVIHYFLQARAEIKLPLAMGSAVIGLLLFRVLSASRELRKKRHVFNITGLIDEVKGCYSIDFVDEGISHNIHSDTTVLQAASEIGLSLDSDCQAGVCGTCRIQLIKGEVNMDVDTGLLKDDKAANIILACQAKCLSDISVRRIRKT